MLCWEHLLSLPLHSLMMSVAAMDSLSPPTLSRYWDVFKFWKPSAIPGYANMLTSPGGSMVCYKSSHLETFSTETETTETLEPVIFYSSFTVIEVNTYSSISVWSPLCCQTLIITLCLLVTKTSSLLWRRCLTHRITLYSHFVVAGYSALTQYWTNFDRFCP